MVTRKDITIPSHYANYVNKAGEDDILKALNASTKRFRKLIKDLPKKKIDYAYAEGKWTIRQLLQHIIDAERVFSHRALWFARKEASPQAPFDENNWAQHAGVSKRKWKDMVEEFLALRASNTLMFASFGDEELKTIGTASGNQLHCATFGYVLAGHVQHHIDIIEERYLDKKTKTAKKKEN